MLQVKVKWQGDKFVGALNKHILDGGNTVGQQVTSHIKSLISRPNPGGLSPSAPGEPPKRVTGELMSSIDYDFEMDRVGLHVYVSASAVHAIPLEFGTRYMAARPFMRRGLSEVAPSLLAVFR